LISNAFGQAVKSPSSTRAVSTSRHRWRGAISRRARRPRLVVDDPDVPHSEPPNQKGWVHWIVVDLPATTRSLPEGVARLPGGQMGTNDWSNVSWDGPAPPAGQKHRYRFKLYALDRMLELDTPDKARLATAMRDHVLAEAQLIGTYTANPG
jgi:Raf kinase inhibitor-like YbhB/YbcL family protein